MGNRFINHSPISVHFVSRIQHYQLLLLLYRAVEGHIKQITWKHFVSIISQWNDIVIDNGHNYNILDNQGLHLLLGVLNATHQNMTNYESPILSSNFLAAFVQHLLENYAEPL